MCVNHFPEGFKIPFPAYIVKVFFKKKRNPSQPVEYMIVTVCAGETKFPFKNIKGVQPRASVFDPSGIRLNILQKALLIKCKCIGFALCVLLTGVFTL